VAENDFRSRIILAGKVTGEAAFKKVAGSVGTVTKSLGRMGLQGAKAGAVLATAFGANALRLTTKFEASISDLAAITGATGKDLQFLTDAAKEFGRTTTLSASQSAEAFKLVASAKPDLLENTEALKATTQQAILLAEASGVDLANAASTVGEALNQFGAEADQAARFVNVLAAGAKFGSSEVEQTAEALRNAGVAASQAGLSFEETNAAIQTMASAGVKGSDAGTKLRSVLVKLQVQAEDKFNPAIVGMEQALENLAQANLTTAEKAKLFGERSIITADILVQNRDKFADLTEKMTGTNTALEQSAIRNDNLAGDLKKLNSAFEGLSIELGENFTPLFRDIVQIATQIIGEFTTAAEETEGLDFTFEDLDSTMRKLVATFQIIGTITELVGKTIGAAAALIVTAFSGEFDKLGDIAAAAFDDITSSFDEGFEAAAETTRKKTPRIVKGALGSPEVIEAAKSAGEAVQRSFFEGVNAVETEEAQKAAQKELDKLAAKLESIRTSTLTEVEAEREKFAEINGIIFQAKLAGLQSEEELFALRELATMQHEQRLKDIVTKAGKADKLFSEKTATEKTKFVLGSLQALTAGVASESKLMFRVNQAAALGNAVISIHEGIAKAWALGPIIGPPMAALVAAAGAVQIGAIASAKPGGGTTPSAAGNVATSGGQPVGITGTPGAGVGGFLGGPTGGATGPTQQIDINISGIPAGGVMSTDAVRDLMEQMNIELGDGVNLNVSGA